MFKVYDTDKAVNHLTGESIGNILKVMATKFPQVFFGAPSDMYTQGYIWHFSDDYSAWMAEPEVAEEIRTTAENVTIPNHGYTQYDTYGQLETYDFIVLEATNPESGFPTALFFAYKCTVTNPDASVPETGDTENIVLWTAVLVLAGATLAVVKRKRV